MIGPKTPPTDIPATDLWTRLQEMPRPSKVVDFPRKAPDGTVIGQMRIWILTQEEQMACHAEAEKATRELLKNGRHDEIGYRDLYYDAKCVEMLFRACRDVENPKRSAFPSPQHLRRQFTTVECAALFEHYMTVQLEIGPIAATLSDDEFEAWVKRLAEAGSAFPFDLLSSDVQKILVLSMARRLVSLLTGTSSAGAPPGEPPASDAAEHELDEPGHDVDDIPDEPEDPTTIPT